MNKVNINGIDVEITEDNYFLLSHFKFLVVDADGDLLAFKEYPILVLNCSGKPESWRVSKNQYAIIMDGEDIEAVFPEQMLSDWSRFVYYFDSQYDTAKMIGNKILAQENIVVNGVEHKIKIPYGLYGNERKEAIVEAFKRLKFDRSLEYTNDSGDIETIEFRF